MWFQSYSQLYLTQAGDDIDITVSGQVSITPKYSGDNTNFNWPHFGCTPPGLTGQTGDGVETNTTTVGCLPSNCANSFDGVSSITCNSADNGPGSVECTQQMSSGDYDPAYNATFTGNGPYKLTIEFNLQVPSPAQDPSSAFHYSLGTHLTPPPE